MGKLLLKGQAAEHAQDRLLLRQPQHSAAMHGSGAAPIADLEAGRAEQGVWPDWSAAPRR